MDRPKDGYGVHTNNIGFQLRAERCELRIEEVRYLGFIMDKNRRSDTENIDTLKIMSNLTDLSWEVRHYEIFFPRPPSPTCTTKSSTAKE